MAANQYGGYDSLPHYSQNNFDPESSNISLNNSSSAKPKRPRSDPIDALAALPEVRPIPWKEGKELPPENSTESVRSQTRGALLMVTRGVSRDPRCSRCQDGIGRFTLCVSLPGWFGGACATCQMSTKANRCSLRTVGTENAPNNNPRAIGMHKASITENQDQTSPRKRKRKSTNNNTVSKSQLQEFSSPEIDDGARDGYTAFANNSTNQAAPSNQAPAHEPAAADDSTSLLQYVYQKLNPPNGKKRHHIIDQATGEVQESFGHMGRTPNGTNIAPLNREQMVQDASSQSPSAQLLQSVQAASYTQQSKRDSTKRSETRDDGSQEAALFDSLPRKKQKQILSLIGGLQSGIRTARQQTDTLQKQLDLLQSALGIDFDDEDGG